MKTITIINSRYRKHYIRQLPNQYQHLFLTYDQALVSKDQNRLKKRLATFYEALQSYPHLQLLDPVKTHVDTSQQLLHMLDLMDQYQIDLTNLPEVLDIEKEKKELLLWMDTLPLYRPYRQPKAQPFDQLTYTPHLYTPYQINHLKDHQLLQPKTIQPRFKVAYQALNSSQEIESVAQYLQQHQLKNVLILHGSLNEVAFDFVRYFSQYNLDFDLSYQTANKTTQIFINLVQLTLAPNLDNLINLLALFPFGQSRSQQDLLLYLQQYQPDWEQLPTLNTIENLSSLKELDARQYASLVRLEKSAQAALKTMYPLLEKLDHQHLLSSCFEVLKKTTQNQTSILSLKNQLEGLFTQEPQTLNLEVLNGLLQPSTTHHIEGENIYIASLQDLPPVNFETIILMGLTKNNYPITSIFKGFFDELYAAKIHGFPSLEQRQRLLNQQFETIFTMSERLIYSTHRIDHDGKSIEQSFELDQQLEKEQLAWTDWPYLETTGQPLAIQPLSPEVVESLVFKDGKLPGSVSSFETYFNCSYQYFFEYLLYIRPPRQLDTDVALMGTIAHDVFEQLIEDLPDSYLNVDGTTLQQYLEKYQRVFFQLYPYRIRYFSHVFQLVELNLLETLKRLAQIAPLNKEFKPLVSEFSFKNETSIDPDNILHLNGFIDRIDQSKDGLIILDYKSSDQALSASSIYNGQQLQLILYGIIASKRLNLPLLGVYYISLKNSFESSSILQHAKRSYQFEINKPLQRPSYKLAGYTFQENPLMAYARPAQVKDLQAILTIYEDRFLEMLAELKRGEIDENRQNDLYFPLKNLQRYKESRKLYLTKAKRDNIKFNSHAFRAKKEDEPREI